MGEDEVGGGREMERKSWRAVWYIFHSLASFASLKVAVRDSVGMVVDALEAVEVLGFLSEWGSVVKVGVVLGLRAALDGSWD